MICVEPNCHQGGTVTHLTRRSTVLNIPDVTPQLPQRTCTEKCITCVSLALFAVAGIIGYAGTVAVIVLDARQ